MNPFIDECQPWPNEETPAPPPHAVRATIDNGITHVIDAAADVISTVSDELAAAAAEELQVCSTHRPAWRDGASYAFCAVLGKLLHNVPLGELHTVIEELADDFTPRTDKTPEELEIEGFEEWCGAQECVFCNNSFAPEGVAYSIVGTDRACVCKGCDKPQPF